MDIKLVAVDMDGTFLKDDMSYNKSRFLKQYQLMKERNIRFVVASGNQYEQLKSFFPEIADEIAFVAENGANVIDGENRVFCGQMATETVNQVLNVLEKYHYENLIVCGKNSAYIQENVQRETFTLSKKYYHLLQKVADFKNIDDIIFKFAVRFPQEKISIVLEELTNELGGIVTPVSSGHGDVDLIIPGLHKASGLNHLLNRWSLSFHQSAAFGDNGNDLEMIKRVKYGVAMSNAAPVVKNSAAYITQSNNEEGVLNSIDLILRGEYPFN
ncbi:HAD family hydrolase [Bacillus sp. 28A-2]|uniref:Cof-type HAD-IIB family hydrolase n=1 Tax=Bacillus sp. 28A-2 TaxID=2772252 RepID=UPI00168D504A|nr:Cof-type HAD-IIB family hydrolase [Bacillus sp. 28A-2]MBD3861616.1 HAD family hydrolase [Bacillus sp. 28A-2]